MTLESFEAFMTRLSEDEKLREELRTKAPDGLTFDQLAQAAAERGFAFSAEDITGAEGRELSDAELAGVAGGLSTAVKLLTSLESSYKFSSSNALDSLAFPKISTAIFKF